MHQLDGFTTDLRRETAVLFSASAGNLLADAFRPQRSGVVQTGGRPYQDVVTTRATQNDDNGETPFASIITDRDPEHANNQQADARSLAPVGRDVNPISASPSARESLNMPYKPSGTATGSC
jgi:hypothetical protein